MAELSRDFLINMQTKGAYESARQMGVVQQSIDDTSGSLDRLSQRDKAAANQMRRTWGDRLKESRAYLILSGQINKKIQEMNMEAIRSGGILSNLGQTKLGVLGTGVADITRRLRELNAEGGNVNRSLDNMSIKLNATIKESKKLRTMGEARSASKAYVDYGRKFAADTPFEQTEVLSAMSNLSPVFKGDLNKIKNAMQAATILAQIDPLQGFEGAAYAIREAASGDPRSLAARFELSRGQLKRHMATQPDIGKAIIAALKENGQTMEMVTAFTGTKEGMSSNISDSRNYIAGAFNESTYDAEKREMFFRMQMQQRLAQSDGGLQRLAGAAGQAGGLFKGITNSIGQSLHRPLYARGENFLQALAPGLTRAKAAIEKADVEVQISDLNRRFDTLDDAEKEKLRELRRRLREIPIESAKLEREAKEKIRKSGTYLANLLGMDRPQREELIKNMQELSDRFVKYVDSIKKKFSSGDIRKFIDEAVRRAQNIVKVFTAGPIQFFKQLKSSGLLDYFKDTFVEIGRSFGEIFETIFGKANELTNDTSGAVETSKRIADALVLALIRVKPIITFIKNLIVDLLKVINFGVKVITEVIDKALGLLSSGLRLVGRVGEANSIDKQREEIRESSIFGGGNNSGGSGGSNSGGSGNNSGSSSSTPAHEQRGGINPAQAGGIAALLAGGVTAAASVGMFKNLREIYAGGRAGQTGLAGIWGGMKAMGAGGLGMLTPPGAKGFRASFNVPDLLKGKGMGANVVALGANMFLPGPISQIYGMIVGVRNLFDIAKIGGKWIAGYKNMTFKGLGVAKDRVMQAGNALKWITEAPANIVSRLGGMKDNVLNRFRGINLSNPFARPNNPGIRVQAGANGINTILQNEMRFLREITGERSRAGKFMDSIRNTISGINSKFSPIMKSITELFAKLGSMFKNLGSKIGSIGTGVKNIMTTIGTKLSGTLAYLLKIPVLGPILKGLGIAAGSTAASVASSGMTGYQAGSFAMKQKIGRSGQSGNEAMQHDLLMFSANNPIVARLLGIDQKAARDTLDAMKKEKAQAPENGGKVNKSEGTRHQGGYVPKSGNYTLQSGEYVLPAGGFKFNTFANTSSGISTQADSKSIIALLSNTAVIAASARYSETILRMLGITRNESGMSVSPGSAAGLAASSGNPAASAGERITGKPLGALGGATSGISAEQKAMFDKVLRAAAANGDKHPEVAAAQWAIESGWGKHQSGENNYFGIKARAGEDATVRRTAEQDANGNVSYINARFKNFASLEDGIKGRVDLLNSSRYQNAGYGTAATSAEAIAAVKRAGYATDVNYTSKLEAALRMAGIDPSSRSSSIINSNNTRLSGGSSQAAGGTTINVGGITIKHGTKDQMISSLKEAQNAQMQDFKNKLATAGRTHAQ